jgi:4-amino-4-deoxy-L-arabinose transferase-like glycosyltransferase
VADVKEPTRLPWAGLAAAATVAFLLRWHFAGEQSLGYEEVFTRTIVHQATISRVWDATRATESTPPAYYMLVWLWLKLTGTGSAAGLRAVSVIAGTLTVPVTFAAIRSFCPRRVALAGAVLAAISPILVDEGIYARSYALLVLVSALSMWALGAVLAHPGRRTWTLWVLAAALCLWTHYFTGFVIAGEVAVLAVRRPGQRRALVAAAAGVLVLAAPLWSLFRAQSSASQRTEFISARPLTGRLEDTVRQFAMGINVPSAALEAVGILIVAGAIAIAVVRGARRAPTRSLVAVVLVGAGLPIATAVIGFDDHLLARNVLGVWVFLAAVAAAGLVRLRGVPLLAYGVVCLASVTLSLSDWRYQGAADWAGTARVLGTAARGEPIAILPGQDIDVAALYLGRPKLTAPVSSRDLWVIAEPERAAGSRALGRVADLPLGGFAAGLRPVGEHDRRGFRIVHLQAGTPVTIAPTPAGGGPAGTGAVLLAP